MNILDEIVAYKRLVVKEQKATAPYRVLEQSDYFEKEVVSLTHALKNTRSTSIIAEFKRKSPSKGMINEFAIPEEITKGYADAGAAGLSVLTDEKYFGGSTADLMKAREANTVPILRKDFTIDEYQVVEAKSMGADAILLIAACLSGKEVMQLARSAKKLRLQVILEVHEPAELNRINGYIDIVGVNNRNLKTFNVDITTSLEIVKHIPPEFLKISESGISKQDAVRKLTDCGYDGFLIGENFMKEKDPARAFREFLLELK
ncbi:MAG: indole-3-glycerol phosphate synthase TrpC [Bacteroidales bacterium]|nr:indole-3-glycerol phosphate synthase TrpC [Bacteroidales bacterium]